MKQLRLFSLLLTLGALTIASSSCEVIDPYDPGNSGSRGDRRSDTVDIEPNEEIIYEIGTIKKITGEDGFAFWGFQTQSGRRFEPTNLSAEYMIDGLKVELTAEVLGNWSSPHRYGALIEIMNIRSLGQMDHRYIVKPAPPTS